MFSFPRLIDFLASHEIDGVRKEKTMDKDLEDRNLHQAKILKLEKIMNEKIIN